MSTTPEGSAGERLSELVLRWEALREQGNDLPAEQLCGDCPELATELGRRLAKLRAMGPVLESECESVGATGPTTRPATPAGPACAGREEARSQAVYDELQFHDEGGLGKVYIARDAELNREVALKFIQPRRVHDPDAHRRFLLEAVVTARLEHPGIVPVYGLGHNDSGQPCYAMRLIRGVTLQEAIDQFHAADHPDRDRAERVRALRGLLRRFVSVCNTVAYAHSRGVLHRDLKPRNILLDQYEATLVVDWGLAKLLDPHVGDAAPAPGAGGLMPSSGAGPGTTTESPVGTPQFMSPEQAEGRPLGPASDIYSLGTTLYVLLTGRMPFPRRREVPWRVIGGKFPGPRRVKPAVPRALEAVCLKAMALRPEQRYATALDLAADLERWLAGDPVSAWREPLATRVVRWARRHKPAVVGSVTALAVAALSAGAMLVVNGRRIATLQHEAQGMILRGQAASSIEDYPRAKLLLSSAVAKLGSETALAGLKADAERLLDEIHRYEKFLERRDEVLFRGTLRTGLGLPDQGPTTESACREALQLFGVDVDVGVDVDSDAGPALDPHRLSGRKEVVAGCYELLMILAEAVADRGTDRAPEAHGLRLRRALRILDRAVRLGPPTQAYHLRRAGLLARLGDEAGAVRERARAAALRPTRAVDSFLLGDQCFRRGELEQAIHHFDAALRVQPDHFWSQYFLAVGFLRLHRPDEAKAHLTACLGRRPGFLWLYVHRGFAQEELGAFEAAEDDFRTALAFDPGVEARYSIHVLRGVGRIRQKRFEAAAADLEAAIALMPDQSEAYVDLAQAYRGQGRIDAALEQLSKAIRLRPESAPAYLNRASLSRERGDSPAALRDFEQAIRFEPPESPFVAQIHLERGRILDAAGKFPEAIAACDAALRTRPDDPTALLLRARALLQLGQFEEARRSCDRYLERWAGPPADIFRIRGLARKQLGDAAAAAEDYTRALEMAPGAGAELFTDRGWAYIACEAWKLALRDFEEAIRLGPPESDAYNGRGYVRTRLGHHGEGVADAEEALRLEPRSPEMMHNIACTFALAVGQVEGDEGLPDREHVAERYRRRALETISRALDLVPADRRRSFWQETMLPDADLDPIRRSPGFGALREELSPPGR
jgi:tetratricopeptide (TPR) repeat protein